MPRMPMLRRNIRSVQVAVWAGMAILVMLGWFYMIRMNIGMSDMPHMAVMTMPAATGLETLATTFLMWAVMMTAMMLPSTVPAVSAFIMLAGRRPRSEVAGHTSLFIAGYVVVWGGYSAPAAVAQWTLMQASMMTPMGRSTSMVISAAILVAAGLFQFSPLKSACLTKCRSPFAFLMTEWRDGANGAFTLGLRHGGYCVGCCWALMGVLLVVGVMSLLWMAIFTLLVLAEKALPARWRFDRAVGICFVLSAIGLALEGIA